MSRRPWIELGVIVAAVLAMPLVLPVGQRGAPPAPQPVASAPAAPGAGSLLHAGPDSALIVDILRPADGQVFVGVQHLRGAETGKTIYGADCSRQTLEDLRSGRRRSWAGADTIWALLGRAACEPRESFGAPGRAGRGAGAGLVQAIQSLFGMAA